MYLSLLLDQRLANIFLKESESRDFIGGPDSMLLMQGARVRSLVRELDPACRN